MSQASRPRLEQAILTPRSLSSGNVNTVDVMYPAMPFFLYSNPELLRFNLEPLYQNQEGGFYPNGYSMHDLGTNFPNATGHVEGNDEYMPVEESGNMILMTYAYYKYDRSCPFFNSMLTARQVLWEFGLRSATLRQIAAMGFLSDPILPTPWPSG